MHGPIIRQYAILGAALRLTLYHQGCLNLEGLYPKASKLCIGCLGQNRAKD